MLLLLENYEIVHPLPDDPLLGKVHLVPCLLPAIRPAFEIAQYQLDDPCPEHMIELNREYVVSFVPSGMIGRLIVRAMHMYKAKSVWRSGIVLTDDLSTPLDSVSNESSPSGGIATPVRFKHQAAVRSRDGSRPEPPTATGVRRVASETSLSSLSGEGDFENQASNQQIGMIELREEEKVFRVRVRGAELLRLASFLLNLLGMMDNLIRDWFHIPEVQILVPCSGCLLQLPSKHPRVSPLIGDPFNSTPSVGTSLTVGGSNASSELLMAPTVGLSPSVGHSPSSPTAHGASTSSATMSQQHQHPSNIQQQHHHHHHHASISPFSGVGASSTRNPSPTRDKKASFGLFGLLDSTKRESPDSSARSTPAPPLPTPLLTVSSASLSPSLIDERTPPYPAMLLNHTLGALTLPPPPSLMTGGSSEQLESEYSHGGVGGGGGGGSSSGAADSLSPLPWWKGPVYRFTLRDCEEAMVNSQRFIQCGGIRHCESPRHTSVHQHSSSPNSQESNLAADDAPNSRNHSRSNSNSDHSSNSSGSTSSLLTSTSSTTTPTTTSNVSGAASNLSPIRNDELASDEQYCCGTISLDLLVPDIALIDVRNSRIEARDIRVQEVIAQGAYGKCYRGVLRGVIPVAIKDLMILPTDSDSSGKSIDSHKNVIQLFHAFRHECRLMSKLRHPNIVNLEGFCTNPFRMVCEFVGGGDLYAFLNDPHGVIDAANKVFDALKQLDRVQLEMTLATASATESATRSNTTAPPQPQSATASHKSMIEQASSHTQVAIEQFILAAGVMMAESEQLCHASDRFISSASSRLEQATKEADANLLESFHSLRTAHVVALGRLSWDVILRIAIDLARGLGFLHGLNPPVLHRDLKTPNCLLTATPNAETVQSREVLAKLSDFGFSSQLFIPTLQAGTEFEKREVNLPTWLAPEILSKSKYSTRSDIYAFGIILWELYTREHPFSEFIDHSIFKVQLSN